MYLGETERSAKNKRLVKREVQTCGSKTTAFLSPYQTMSYHADQEKGKEKTLKEKGKESRIARTKATTRFLLTLFNSKLNFVHSPPCIVSRTIRQQFNTPHVLALFFLRV